MSRALELADAYADAASTHRLESLYGTSKSYTLEKAKERDEAHAALTAELRRLAKVEEEHEALKRAISEADQWKSPEETDTTDSSKGLVWLRENGAVFLGYWFEQPFREYRDTDGHYVGQQDAEAYWARHEDGEPCNPDGWQELIHPLYTLKGIK